MRKRGTLRPREGDPDSTRQFAPNPSAPERPRRHPSLQSAQREHPRAGVAGHTTQCRRPYLLPALVSPAGGGVPPPAGDAAVPTHLNVHGALYCLPEVPAAGDERQLLRGAQRAFQRTQLLQRLHLFSGKKESAIAEHPKADSKRKKGQHCPSGATRQSKLQRCHFTGEDVCHPKTLKYTQCRRGRGETGAPAPRGGSGGGVHVNSWPASW